MANRAEDRIGGAVFDFAAYLTTRPKTLLVGAGEDAAPMAELVKEWADERGLGIDNADVVGWQDTEMRTTPEAEE